MSHENQSSRIPEWANNKPELWFTLAVGIGVFGLALAPFGILWAFGAATDSAIRDRVAIISPIATLYLAVVTFCTVAWRGLVATSQAEQQRRQNDAKDEENLAKLLIDGTKLVSGKEATLAEALSGITALKVVANSIRDQYSYAAMDVLATLANDWSMDDKKTLEFQHVVTAINEAALAGKRSAVEVKLDCGPLGDVDWPAINGVARVQYTGGRISSNEYKKFQNLNNIEFLYVNIGRVDIIPANKFYNCEFYCCKFTRVSRHLFKRNKFYYCDFSNADVEEFSFDDLSDQIVEFAAAHNFYREGLNPTGVNSDFIRGMLDLKPTEFDVFKHYP